MIRTDKHREKEKTEDDEQQQETSDKTNPNTRQRNTGKARHTASRRKSCECADLRCGRWFVEKSGALVPSQTQWWGRKSCARKQHSTADEPWRRPTSLSLSLAKPLFSFYTLISSFQSPRSRCVHVSRFCGWNSFRGRKRGHSEERLLSWVQRGVLFLFLHGRLRFGRHYMIVRFDEEITTNSHVSGVRRG
jgi:hypothetical protein